MSEERQRREEELRAELADPARQLAFYKRQVQEYHRLLISQEKWNRQMLEALEVFANEENWRSTPPGAAKQEFTWIGELYPPWIVAENATFPDDEVETLEVRT